MDLKNKTSTHDSQDTLTKTLHLFLGLFCLVLPWSLAAMQIALGLVLCMVILLWIRVKSLPKITHPIFIFIAIYVVLRAISALVSPEATFSLAALLQTDWVVLTIPFLIGSLLWSAHLEKTLHQLLLSVVVISIYGIIQFFVGFDIFRGKELSLFGNFYRASGGFSHYLTFAGSQLLWFGLILGVFLAEKNWNRKKYIYLSITLIVLLSLIATLARSAWIGILVIVGLGTLLINRKLFLYAAITMIIIGVIAAMLSPEVQTRITSIFDVSQNENRLTLWKTALRIIEDNPMWGTGPGFFEQSFFKYKVPGFHDATGHAHNDYLNVAVNSGIFAMLSWLSVWGCWFYFALKTFWKTNISEFEKQVLLGSILAITGIMVAAIFQCYWTDLENNIAWWFLGALGLHIVIRHQ